MYQKETNSLVGVYLSPATARQTEWCQVTSDLHTENMHNSHIHICYISECVESKLLLKIKCNWGAL